MGQDEIDHNAIRVLMNLKNDFLFFKCSAILHYMDDRKMNTCIMIQHDTVQFISIVDM